MSALAGKASGEGNLPAELVRALEQTNFVPGERRSACGLETGDAAADHHHAARLRRARQRLRLEARLRVLDAGDRELPEPPRDADVERDALADLGVAAELGLAHQIGIGDLRTGHPDQVAAAILQRSLAELGSRDPSLGDHDGLGNRPLDLLGEPDAESGLEVERRHQELEVVVVAVPDPEVVDVAAFLQVGSGLDVARHRSRQGDAEERLRPERVAQRVENLTRLGACGSRASRRSRRRGGSGLPT